MRRSKGRTEPNIESAQTSLRLRQPAEALSALLRERSRLLKKIAQKQQELEQGCENIRTTMQTMLSKMQALFAERTQLIEDLRSLFDELLAEGRLSRSAHKKVASVFRMIEEDGDLEPLDFEPFAPRPNSETGPGFSEAEASDTEPAPQPDAAAASARHAGGQPGNDSLRGLFRRLTMALHPDRVQHEGEQKRRTDVMKEVTRAYEDGDFARLIEIEQVWLAGGHVESGANDEAAKCAALERTVQELQSQLKAVASELQAVRLSSPLRALFGGRRARSDSSGPMKAMLAAAESELQPLRQMRDFVRSFSERKISLAEFMRGPSYAQPNYDFDDELDLSEIIRDSLMNDFEVVSVSRARRPRPRRKSRSTTTSDDIPF